jgi:signal transduction histidine kinase
VQDSGVGISEEDQKKLFKLFGLLSHNQRMNTKGVGLGLVIGKMITEKFDGDISLDSTVGVGSTFTFKFKLEQQ